jgi:DNA (cytosine-5)-methyltransferase 1
MVAKMKFISLFAGIGGFDLGLERAGMQCVAQVEIDPFCLKVLEKHWPDVPRFEDVRYVGKDNLPAADLICGGFPCQPHSVSGKRKGAADDRDLWPEYRRIIAECRPRWMLAENVPGIRTTILDQVLSDLEGMDYATGTIIIPACAFDAPHRRERVFIVAYPRCNSLAQLGQSEQGSGECGDGRGIPANDSWKFWTIEPPVGRVANGIPGRVDRLRSLGNAVVPQVVEWIGRMIVEIDNANS